MFGIIIIIKIMKKFTKVFLFFLFTPFTLSLAALVLFSSLDKTSNVVLVNPKVITVLAATNQNIEYDSSSPPLIGSVSSLIETEDARPLLIKNYLEKYQSPLSPYFQYIFDISQKYNLDYGLIVAIAQCESNVCKKIPPNSYNCWGFGNGESKFNSWEDAIEYVARTLKEDYYDQGLVTPDEIMPKYVPPSVEKGGPWAKCVNQYLSELR
jgi:hypothetical protein